MALIVWLAFCGANHGAGQDLGRPALLIRQDLLDTPAANRAASTNLFVPPVPSDLLQFLDGSSLHGRLKTVSVESGLSWQHPDSVQPLQFQPTNLAWIRFENAKSLPDQIKPACRFRFKNGDEVFGQVTAMDDEHLELQNRLGNKLRAPRDALQSMMLLSKDFSILYEGPTGLDGWILGRGPKAWEYRDGALSVNGVSTMGRDFGLKKSSSLEFDLAWTGQFGLILTYYTEVFDRFDYSTSSYMFYLGPGYVTLQRVQSGAGTVNLGQVQVPGMAQKNRARIEIRANRDEATLSILVDGSLVQRWKDSAGFVAKGSGAAFFSQLDGATVRVSNIKVSEWDGSFDIFPSTNAPPKQDLVYLINRDKVPGTISAIRDGKLTLTNAQAKLDIPLARITQIHFADTSTNSTPRSPWEVRAFLVGGGALAFDLDKWEVQEVSGRSSNFGLLTLNPTAFRQVQFNLDRSKNAEDDVRNPATDLWEIDE